MATIKRRRSILHLVYFLSSLLLTCSPTTMAWKFPAKDGSSDNKKQNGDASSEALLLEVLQIPKSELKKLKKTALMGKLFPIVSNFFVSKSDLSLQQIAIAIADLVDEMEVAVFVAVGWGLVPFTRSMYDVYLNVTSDSNNIDNDNDADDTQQSDLNSAVFLDEDETAEPQKSISRKMYEALTPWDDDEIRRSKRLQEASTSRNRRLFRANMFQKSLLYQIVDHVSQAARVGISVIAVDCIALVGKLMGHNANTMDNFSRIFSKVAYTGWITHRLQVFKSYLLRNTFGKAKVDMGKLNIIDHLLDGMMYTIWSLCILDFLEVQTGMALKSLFSVGATGTLIFGLASKDLATQIMNGLTLHMSDKMFEGDEVRFSDGTSGIIVKMGWMETMIRSSDELVVGIPNTHLSGQRVYNLSRTPQCQVKQTLRISYNDADKIPKLLDAIKDEIKEACPKLIKDGSRAFRAVWQNYEDDHLAVVVDAHFRIKPTGDEYWSNRQKMLEAIYRAVKKTGVHFETAIKAK